MPGLVRLWKRHLASVIAKLLHLFERILLYTGPNTLLDDAVEIDEYFPAQEPIHLLLPSGIAEHQAFDCGRFVGREVINMQIGEASHSLERQIDEPLERGPLLCPVQSPAALVDKIPVVTHYHTEEVFQAALSDKRIAFEIEKDVADR